MSLASEIRVFRPAAQALVLIFLLAGGVSCDGAPADPAKGPRLFLSPPSAAISVGDSAIFSASSDGLESGGYRWTSSAPGVVAVSATGVARGLAPGRSTITVASSARPTVRSAAIVDVRPP